MEINKIYETDPVEVYNDDAEGEQLYESILICTIPDEEEFDEFCYMTHDEQIEALGLFKEKTITNKSQNAFRYFIDVGENFIVVRTNTYTFY